MVDLSKSDRIHLMNRIKVAKEAKCHKLAKDLAIIAVLADTEKYLKKAD
jgi:hypothetical protein